MDTWILAHITFWEWAVTVLSTCGLAIVGLCLSTVAGERRALHAAPDFVPNGPRDILAAGHWRTFGLLGINSLLFLSIGVSTLAPQTFHGLRITVLTLGVVVAVLLEQIVCAAWVWDRARVRRLERLALPVSAPPPETEVPA